MKWLRGQRKIEDTVKIATASKPGYINDHVELCPDPESILMMALRGSPTGDTQYSVVLRRDYSTGTDEKSDKRGWLIAEAMSGEMPEDEATGLGQEIAERENIVLYKGINMQEAHIIWKPESWEPIQGQ